MRLTIGMKLGLGFGLMITLIVAICGVVYTQLLAVQHIQDTVLQVRQPTVLTSAELLSGLSRSQAALRGYLILGDDQSKAALADSWLFIDEDLKKLAALSVDWDEQKDIRHLKEIAAVFNELRDAHHQAEQIAQAPENTPATHLLISQATPKVDAMMTQLATLIEEEKYQEGSEDRKAMLAMMADARGLLASSFGSLRGYVISGDQKDSKAFKTQWLEQQEMVASLDSDSWMLTDLQTESFQAYLTIQSGFDDLTDRVIELRQSDRWNVANHLLATEAAPKATRLEQMLNELIDSHRTRAIADTGELETMTASLVVLLGIVAAIGLTLGIFISWSLKRMIVRSIKPIATRAKAIAQGDLTGKDLPILAPDEIGQLTNSVNEMSHSLSEVVTEVTNSARDVAAAATQIAASSEQMSVGMNEQSQQILQISSAMTQMKVTVIEVASKSNLAASNAAESGQVAREGGQVVDQTIEGIREISKAVQAGSASVAELGKRGQQIGKIIDVINDIADQTNLLALNAAIEAARAGEHGRGFAVVADEVRKLADRTTKATGEIATSIKSIQTETDKAIDRMSVGTEQVDTGVRTAQEAGESLKKILTGAQTVTDMIQAIAAAAEQQSAASEQVTQNVEVVASVSRQAGEGANQASIAASQLSIKAEELQVLVGKFKLDEDQTHDAGPVQATIEVTEYAA